jgi:hypothetical protein
MPIVVIRLSDNQSYVLPEDFNEKKFVKSVKSQLRKNFVPKYPNGCRLKYNGKVMKSRHHLHHYGVVDGVTIEMDDRKNWSSSSSSSSSTD